MVNCRGKKAHENDGPELRVQLCPSLILNPEGLTFDQPKSSPQPFSPHDSLPPEQPSALFPSVREILLDDK